MDPRLQYLQWTVELLRKAEARQTPVLEFMDWMQSVDEFEIPWPGGGDLLLLVTFEDGGSQGMDWTDFQYRLLWVEETRIHISWKATLGWTSDQPNGWVTIRRQTRHTEPPLRAPQWLWETPVPPRPVVPKQTLLNHDGFLHLTDDQTYLPDPQVFSIRQDDALLAPTPEMLHHYPNLQQYRSFWRSYYRQPDGRWSQDLPVTLPHLWLHSSEQLPLVETATQVLVRRSHLAPSQLEWYQTQYEVQCDATHYLLTRRSRAKSARSEVALSDG